MIFNADEFVFKAPSAITRARRVLIKPSAGYPLPVKHFPPGHGLPATRPLLTSEAPVWRNSLRKEPRAIMASELQIEANRRNSKRSTGPKTPEGKAASRLNALKHGLTARDAVIPGEDKRQFNQLLNAYLDHLQPVDPVETLLVQQMVMAAWRLTRARAMEVGAYTLSLILDR